MKKKTKLQTVAAAEPERTHRTGPVKEKTQITVRIDKQLLNQTYAKIKEDNTRITDMIERGLILALGEAKHYTPPWTRQIRFVLANATKEQVELIRGLAIAMVEHEVAGKLSPESEQLFELCKWFLKTRNEAPHGVKALEVYARYGKSADEIAKMA